MKLFKPFARINDNFLKTILFVAVMLLFSAVVFASGGHGGEHAAPKSVWHDIDTWKVLNFAILAIFLFVVAKKPVKEFFTSRIKGIENELAELEKKKSDAQKQIAEFEAKLKDLEGESQKIIDAYIKQGKEAKERILAQAEEEASKLEDMAKRNIEMEFKTARTELKRDITEKAISEAEKIIQSSISKEDQDRLVGEYLEKVVA